MFRSLVVSLAALSVAATPASAQLAVVDNANLAKALETARNTLRTIERLDAQLEEAQRLYNSVNGVTDIQSVASLLDQQRLRGDLPDGFESIDAYISDDLNDLGALSGRAQDIFSSTDLGSLAGSSRQALEVLGRRVARDQALAEYELEQTEDRARGVATLEDRLASATTQREIDEVSARTQIETLGALNEMARRDAARELQLADSRKRRLEEDARWRANLADDTAATNSELRQAMGQAARQSQFDITWGPSGE